VFLILTATKWTTSSTMAERPRDESAIVRGWVTLSLNFRLKGYVSCQYLWTVRWEWLCYDFAARSFHVKKLCSSLYSIEIEKSFLSNPLAFEGLMNNARTPSIARWKSCRRISIRHNWTFSLFYGWDVVSGNLSNSAFFERVGSIWAQISDGRGIAHQPLLVSK